VIWRVINARTGQVVCSQCLEARRAEDRRRGLLGRVELLPGEGLLIIPCAGVHSRGMAFPIVALYLNRYGEVLLRRDLLPGQPGLTVPETHAVLELRPEDARLTVKGDWLRWY
jgi:hypothetical protein